MPRAAAVERTLATLRFFWNSPQGGEPDATGYKGFYYHFLDMQTGRRAWQCELSTVDSAFLLAGALTAGMYFDAGTADESEIRTLGDALYRRADWQWAQNQGATVTHGWKPEAASSTTGGKATTRRCCCISWGSARRLIRCPRAATQRGLPLTGGNTVTDRNICTPGRYLPISSRMSGLTFAVFRTPSCIDYFENSRRATYVQQRYAIDNPLKFNDYGSHCWGISASEGPGPGTIKVNGIERRFFDYLGRGVPYGPDDGTLAPWAVVASLPFAPEIVLPALDYCIHQAKLTELNSYGFKASFNPSHPGKSGNPYGWWVSPWHYGLNQGSIILMIENYHSELLWQLMRKYRYVADGLRRAGFDGGWL
jgi:hypothetical protein